MVELITADLKSQYPLLAVLTDLMYSWQFFFLGEEKSIISFIATRGQAVGLLQNELKDT